MSEKNNYNIGHCHPNVFPWFKVYKTENGALLSEKFEVYYPKATQIIGDLWQSNLMERRVHK